MAHAKRAVSALAGPQPCADGALAFHFIAAASN